MSAVASTERRQAGYREMVECLWRRDGVRTDDVGRFYDQAAIDPPHPFFGPSGTLVATSYEAALALYTLGTAYDILVERQGTEMAEAIEHAFNSGTGAWREILSAAYKLEYGVTYYYGRHKIRDNVIGKIMTGLSVSCQNADIGVDSTAARNLLVAVFGPTVMEFLKDFTSSHAAGGRALPTTPDSRRKVPVLFDIHEMRDIWDDDDEDDGFDDDSDDGFDHEGTSGGAVVPRSRHAPKKPWWRFW